MDYVAFERERVICVIREFDFRSDGEKICPYHSPCMTESIIVCVYTLGCNSQSHLSSPGGGGGGGGNTLLGRNWYLLPYMVKFPLSWIFNFAHDR